MGLFGRQTADMVEWNETNPDVLFWKWDNDEIKKNSKLMIRPGQDAIFLYNGKIEGIFEEEGIFEIESEIIPFLSTLKSFRFGFSNTLRAEVLFVNTKEVLVKWGTRNVINLPAPQVAGGIPVRAFGTFSCRVGDHRLVLEKLAGIRHSYTVEDVKERMITVLNPMLMSWIGKEGQDMFNLQSDAGRIGDGICRDMNLEMSEVGIEITNFTIESFSYPEEVRKTLEREAARVLIQDQERCLSTAEAGANEDSGKGKGPRFCPDCGTPSEGARFCSNCGNRLV